MILGTDSSSRGYELNIADSANFQLSLGMFDADSCFMLVNALLVRIVRHFLYVKRLGTATVIEVISLVMVFV